jgi:hypothetical protein
VTTVQSEQDKLLSFIQERSGASWEQCFNSSGVGEGIHDPDEAAALLNQTIDLLLEAGRIEWDGSQYVAAAPAEFTETELGKLRRDAIEWLERQPAWQRMPDKQRAVIATAIKKHFGFEKGLCVGPKRMIREYRGKVDESTINRARRAMKAAGLEISIENSRPNGSTTTSLRFLPPAFYMETGRAVPQALAEREGWGVVVSFEELKRQALEAVEAATG